MNFPGFGTFYLKIYSVFVGDKMVPQMLETAFKLRRSRNSTNWWCRYACVKTVGQEHWHQWCVHWLGRSISDSLVWSHSRDVRTTQPFRSFFEKMVKLDKSHIDTTSVTCLFVDKLSESLKKSCQHKICPKTNTGQTPSIWSQRMNVCSHGLLIFTPLKMPFLEA